MGLPPVLFFATFRGVWTGLSVGVPVGVTCRMLGAGTISERGALPAEACIPPEPFFKLLAERNLHTSVMVRHFLNSESEKAQ